MSFNNGCIDITKQVKMQVKLASEKLKKTFFNIAQTYQKTQKTKVTMTKNP